MTNTVDSWTLRHLGEWIDEHVGFVAQEAVQEAMLAELANDSDYYCSAGWRVLFDAVDGRVIEMSEERKGSGYFELLDGIA